MNRTKYKLRNIIFSIICLLSNGLYADANKNKEIGQPYFSFESRRHLTLAPDGKTFYALEGKKPLVSRYQIYPFEKIESFQIPKLKSPFMISSSSKILIYEDGKKLLFYKPNSLILFDIETKKIINKVEFDRYSDRVLLSNERVITLFSGRHSNQIYRDSNVYSFIEFQVWSANDLSKINTVSYFEGSKSSNIRITKFNKVVLIKLENYVLFILLPKGGMTTAFTQQQPSLVIFDGKTLEPEFITSFEDHRNTHWSNFRFDYAFSKAYVLNAETYNAEAFPNSQYQTPTSKATLEIDLKTLERKVVTMSWDKLVLNTIGLHVPDAGVSSLHFSQVGNYASWWNHLFDAKKREESMFYLFSDGEAVLQNKKTKKFKLTEHARKHLKMTNSKGKVVPMNKATFMKYNMMGVKP